MPPKFPTDRQEKRAVLLNAVEEVRGVLEAGADEAESLRTLPMSTVNALYDSGLLWLKLPASWAGPRPTWLPNWKCWRPSATSTPPLAGAP